MNVFLLMVALTGPVEAPRVGLQEATAATAAVAKVAVLPEACAVSAAETAPPRNDASQWGEGVPPAQIAKATIPPRIGVWPEPKSDADCTLIGIYAKRRMLSGPWSASRRLEAARIRGDEDEVKRMEAMLDDLLGKALFEEPD